MSQQILKPNIEFLKAAKFSLKIAHQISSLKLFDVNISKTTTLFDVFRLS
jgi:hypothetical protein